MEALQALEARKSVRSYLPNPVEAEKLETIIAAGKHAPNAGPFQISVISKTALLQDIDNETLEAMKNSGSPFLVQRASIRGYHPLYGAPVLILLSAPTAPYAIANTSCAATTMIIAATALGLGSCYVVSPTLVLQGGDALSVQAGVNTGYTPLCGVLIGYEAESTIPKSEHGTTINVNFVD